MANSPLSPRGPGRVSKFLMLMAVSMSAYSLFTGSSMAASKIPPPPPVPPHIKEMMLQLQHVESQPTRPRAGFQMPGYYVWGASVIFCPEDQQYHMFASRWPSAHGSAGWVVASEIVRATSSNPDGPYTFAEVVLPRRGVEWWDGLMTHNPHVIRHPDGRLLLFYIGVSYSFAPPDPNATEINRTQYEMAWNTKRVGVTIARATAGPWQRSPRPLLQPRPDKWDRAITSNPTATILPNGSVLLLYKSIRLPYPERTGSGEVFYLGAAIASQPAGPYVRISDEPILTHQGQLIAAEDPFLWRCGSWYHLIFKAMNNGRALGLSMGDLTYVTSTDLFNWSRPVRVYSKQLTMCAWNYTLQKHAAVQTAVKRLERPQILFLDQNPCTISHIFFGTTIGEDARRPRECRNIAIPLGNLSTHRTKGMDRKLWRSFSNDLSGTVRCSKEYGHVPGGALLQDLSHSPSRRYNRRERRRSRAFARVRHSHRAIRGAVKRESNSSA